MATEQVPATKTVLGIDLGGARMNTTGIAVLEGMARPKLVRSDVLKKSGSANAAETELLELLEDVAPQVVAIDAPLTLPPCLTCPSFCRGPSSELCELDAARRTWAAGGHPVTERLCEVRLRTELESGPLPTMRIGQIAGRGVSLARRILAGGTKLGPPGSVQVLEVYPYATLARLKDQDPRLTPRKPEDEDSAFAGRVVAGLSGCGLDLGDQSVDSVHAVDALVAASTGWLGPDGLEEPPADFNVASGWIWLPKPAASA